jgi:hypothetical protein
MYEEQEGLCALCGKAEIATTREGNLKRLGVDHNHITGRVRGLLCTNCNMALGNFLFDIEGTKLLYKAIEYWRKYEIDECP